MILINTAKLVQFFCVEKMADIRELITLEDVMTEMNYGPNGGLVYCFE